MEKQCNPRQEQFDPGLHCLPLYNCILPTLSGSKIDLQINMLRSLGFRFRGTSDI